MPRTLDIERPAHPKQQWTDITIEQLQHWQELNLSGFQIRVLMALKLYAWNGRTCFPSLDSIADRIGLHTKTRQQQVSRALRQLEEHGLIQRNDRRQKPDRFVLLPIKPIGQVDGAVTEPIGQQKQTQLEEDSSPLNPPTHGGKDSKIKEESSVSSIRRPKRTMTRRKRLRRRDLELIEQTRIEQEQEAQRKREMIEAYKQAQEQAPSILKGLLEEHTTQDKPTDEQGLTRAFWVASVLAFYGWNNDPLHKPPHITRVSQMLDEQAQQDSWNLRLNVHQLWEFIRRNNDLEDG